ncbi:MAG TPA: hypothetical protein VMZ05_11630 [Spirochaetota bacterium]|nr:hypothetical protein [Spirochaetota bacterium]
MFGRSAQCIDWNSPDGLPDGLKTRFTSLILTPLGAEDEHVQILKMLSEIMSDRETASRLSHARGMR